MLDSRRPRSKVTDRMVAVMYLYYRPPDDLPLIADHQFSRILQSRQLPSSLTVELTANWQPVTEFSLHLEEQISIIWVKNAGPDRVEIGFTLADGKVQPALCVPPGEAWPFPLLLSPATMALRSIGGAKATIVCFPE